MAGRRAAVNTVASQSGAVAGRKRYSWPDHVHVPEESEEVVMTLFRDILESRTSFSLVQLDHAAHLSILLSERAKLLKQLTSLGWVVKKERPTGATVAMSPLVTAYQTCTGEIVRLSGKLGLNIAGDKRVEQKRAANGFAATLEHQASDSKIDWTKVKA